MHTSVPLQARSMSASGVHLPRRHRLRQLCSSVVSPAAHATAVLSAVACMSCRSRPPMLPPPLTGVIQVRHVVLVAADVLLLHVLDLRGQARP